LNFVAHGHSSHGSVETPMKIGRLWIGRLWRKIRNVLVTHFRREHDLQIYKYSSVIWTGVPDVVYLAGNFCFANRKNFCFLNFQLWFTDKNFKQRNCFWLSMHAYRILLPSETDDRRFNSREKHMLTDSVQPYNKPITDLACSVFTVKYQTSVFCMDLAPSSLGPY
jgi:hypothetical protein